jgi:hypothetical protein
MQNQLTTEDTKEHEGKFGALGVNRVSPLDLGMKGDGYGIG